MKHAAYNSTAAWLRAVCVVALATHASTLRAQHADAVPDWRWRALPDLPDATGVAGAFVGPSNGAVIVAGGSPDGPSAARDPIRVLNRESFK